MNEEEKKAIEWLNKYIKNIKHEWQECDDSKAVRTVLNLITKLQKENEEKDKQIDLMIEEYEYDARINFKNFCEDELRKDKCIQDCKICAKQYFETKAKKGE